MNPLPPTPAPEVPELLPCPFCAGKAEVVMTHRDHWIVQCLQCGIQQDDPSLNDSGAGAIAAWNQRAPVPAAWMEAACAEFFDLMPWKQEQRARHAQGLREILSRHCPDTAKLEAEIENYVTALELAAEVFEDLDMVTWDEEGSPILYKEAQEDVIAALAKRGLKRSLHVAIDRLAHLCGFPIVEDRTQVLDTVGKKVERLTARTTTLEADNAALRKALEPFANVFGGDLKDIGGGTALRPEIACQCFKDAKAALSNPAPSAWRTMEDAPRDGTWMMCRWSYDTGEPMEGEDEPGRCVDGDWQTSAHIGLGMPSHWQPLPTPQLRS